MSEYARAGVDYTKIEPFKRAMMEVGGRTLGFPKKWSVRVEDGNYFYYGERPHVWRGIKEGLGNKNWIAEWMYQLSCTGRTYHNGIGVDTALMAVNDLIAFGAMPVIYLDEVAASDSEWFQDEKRAEAFAEGLYSICEEVGMALLGGESSSLRYLVKAEPPVERAPVFSGTVTGIIAPNTHAVTGKKLCAGDCIIAATSSGLHANGITLVIDRALKLPEQFLTKLPNGNSLGEEALIPTRSYVALVSTLLDCGVDVHALQPGTGGGVAKIAFHKRPFTYRIHSWVPIPPLFLFMQELDVSLHDCLTTFNWGGGYYIFVPPHEVARTIELGSILGYKMAEVGVVEEGERKVIFEPEGIILPPPGE